MTAVEPGSQNDELIKDVVEDESADAEFIDDQADPDIEGGPQETLVGIHAYSQFSGPLPHPALFAQYNEVLSGAAERIFQMTEKQLDHAIELENAEASANRSLLDAEIATATRAQWFTFVLVLVFLGLAAYALYKGQPIASITAGLAALATIAYALRGKKDPQADNASSAGDKELPTSEEP